MASSSRRSTANPVPNAIAKEIDHINAPYRALIEAAPFLALATTGRTGIDCSPRGDAPGFVRVHDDKTLLIPDRRGNNRIDRLRNLIRDPRIALLFLIPGCGETIRVNGRAAISTDPALCESFVDPTARRRAWCSSSRSTASTSSAPRRSVRSKLWDTSTWQDRKSLPSTGKILAAITNGKHDADKHDREYPQRLRETIY